MAKRLGIFVGLVALPLLLANGGLLKSATAAEQVPTAAAIAFQNQINPNFGPGGPSMSDEDARLIGGAFLIFAVIFMVIMLAVTIVVLYLLHTSLGALPPEYRIMEPGMVWLLLIPCFNIVWNFFVFQRIPRSYRNYFADQGRTDVGDCGEQLGLWYSITVALSIVPVLQYLTGPASLVLLIIFLVKILSLKKDVVAVAPAA